MPGLEVVTTTLGLVAALWYWWDSVSARDAALGAVQKACREANVQLLDRAISRERIRPVRDDRGRLNLLRIYGFEFTSDGARRHRGLIALVGRRVVEVRMEPYRLVGVAEVNPP